MKAFTCRGSTLLKNVHSCLRSQAKVQHGVVGEHLPVRRIWPAVSTCDAVLRNGLPPSNLNRTYPVHQPGWRQTGEQGGRPSDERMRPSGAWLYDTRMRKTCARLYPPLNRQRVEMLHPIGAYKIHPALHAGHIQHMGGMVPEAYAFDFRAGGHSKP